MFSQPDVLSSLCLFCIVIDQQVFFDDEGYGITIIKRKTCKEHSPSKNPSSPSKNTSSPSKNTSLSPCPTSCSQLFQESPSRFLNILETESDPFNLIDGDVPDSPLPEPQAAPKLLLQENKRRLEACYNPAVKTTLIKRTDRD